MRPNNQRSCNPSAMPPAKPSWTATTCKATACPATMTSAQFVTAIYGNVFNKTPDTEGLNYWRSFFDQGTSQ